MGYAQIGQNRRVFGVVSSTLVLRQIKFELVVIICLEMKVSHLIPKRLKYTLVGINAFFAPPKHISRN